MPPASPFAVAPSSPSLLADSSNGHNNNGHGTHGPRSHAPCAHLIQPGSFSSSSSSPSSFLSNFPSSHSLPPSPFIFHHPSPHHRGSSPHLFSDNNNHHHPQSDHFSYSSHHPYSQHHHSLPPSPLSSTSLDDRYFTSDSTRANPGFRHQRFDSTANATESHSTLGHTANSSTPSCTTTSSSRHLQLQHPCPELPHQLDNHNTSLPTPPSSGSVDVLSSVQTPARPPRRRSRSLSLATVYEQPVLNHPSYYSTFKSSEEQDEDEQSFLNMQHHQHYHSSLQPDIKPLTGLPRSMGGSPQSSSNPQFPSRNQSQHYQSLDAHAYQHYGPGQPQPPPPQQIQQQQNYSQAHGGYNKPKIPLGMTEEEFEEMEDRRRMQQQILRDKLAQADSRSTPDPAMTVKMTTNTGFALGTFDMSESLAIVEDLLDYFGEDELAALETDGDERFNESQLIEAERCHLQRESLVRHLYDSEEDYLRSLQEIQSCYQQPLLHNLQHPDTAKKTLLGAAGAGKSVATKEEIETLFGNLDQLIAFHEDIRTMLEDRSKIWGPTQIMSDLLLHVIPRFKIYSTYFTNFHAALTVLDRISRTPQYKKFMEQCVVDNPPGTASLHLMLAFPLKRLSTYRDLIYAICQATQPSHPDYYNLMRAQEAVNIVASELRQERTLAQDQLALWDIQSNMVGLPEPIMITSRHLLLRADLHKVDASLQLEPRTYYLMNDMLLYARFDPKRNIYQFKGIFDLVRSQVNNAEDNPTLPQLPNSIQIANQGRKQMMKCRSREERDLWLRTMRDAVESATRNAPAESAPLRKDTLPLFIPSGPIGTDSGSIAGSTSYASRAGSTHGSVSINGHSRPFSDSRSVTSKSSNDTTGSGTQSTTRKPNLTDFYGGSFGADLNVNMNEDNHHRSSPLALSAAMSKNSSSSSVSTGATTTSSSVTSSKPGLGAMLAAIPVEELTPKQAKAKAALAAAVEARRQERLMREMKNGGTPVKSEMNKNVNLDFSSSFIPAKERIAKT